MFMQSEMEDSVKYHSEMRISMFTTREFEEKFCYDGNDLGATYSKEQTTFKVWAPTASQVAVRIFSKGSEEEVDDQIICQKNLKAGDRGVYSTTVKGDLDGYYYTYAVTVEGVTRETGDVYAKACGVNGKRSMIINLERTNPEGWENDRHVLHSLEDTEIWEVHVGDFSNDDASGVSPEYRGKFMAFTEQDTTLNGDGVHPTCVNYLKSLGITHVHLLPSFDFASIDESCECDNINWGYDPANYNVPEGSYSTNPYDGAVRINEFKQMVMALHKAGFSVVMDVVYNHTFVTDSNFQKTVPGYYYRQDADGQYSNGSACGNDTASDREMYRKYMVQSVLYWAKEYHVDGFRFDLMGLHDVETMNQIREALNKEFDYGKEMIMYGEPWSAGPSGFRDGAVPANKDAVNELAEGILIFNDDIRDAVKGSTFELESPGYVNGMPGMENRIKQVIHGEFSVDYKHQAETPAKFINYVSAHDNSTLWDKLIDTVLKNHSYTERNEKIVSMNKLVGTIIQLSKGVPFMQAGEEAARTKLGEDNSYNLSKKLNMLDWNRFYEYEDLTNYYRGLIKIRHMYPEIKELTRESANGMVCMDINQAGVVGYRTENLIVIYNAGETQANVSFDGEYKVLIKDGQIDMDMKEAVNGNIQVNGITAAVLVRK